MYLPERSEQTDGYPRFDMPGVIFGYFVNSYAPGVKEASFLYAKDRLRDETGWHMGAESLLNLRTISVASALALSLLF